MYLSKEVLSYNSFLERKNFVRKRIRNFEKYLLRKFPDFLSFFFSKQRKKIFLYGSNLFELIFLKKNIQNCFSFISLCSINEIKISFTKMGFSFIAIDEVLKSSSKMDTKSKKEFYLLIKLEDKKIYLMNNRLSIVDVVPDYEIKLTIFKKKSDFFNYQNELVFAIDKIFYARGYFYYPNYIIAPLKKESYFRIIERYREKMFNFSFLQMRFLRYSFQFFLEESKIFIIENKNLFKNGLGKIIANDLSESKSLFRDEFSKIFFLKKPSNFFEYLRSLDLLESFFPELLEGYKMYQNKYHAYDVYYHCLKSCDLVNPRDLLVRIAALFHDIGKPRSKTVLCEDLDVSLRKRNVFYNHENIGAKLTFNILKRFGFQYFFIKKVSKLVRYHMFYYTREWTDRAVRRFLQQVDTDMDMLFRLRIADRLGSGKKLAYSKSISNLKDRIRKIQEEDKILKIKDLKIDGEVLKSGLFLKEGPLIGNILKYLLKMVQEDPQKNKLEILKNLASEYLESQFNKN